MKIRSKNVMRKKSEQLLSAFWLAFGSLDLRHLLVLMDVINDFTFSTFLLPNSLLDAKVSQNEVQNGVKWLSKSDPKIIDFAGRLRVGCYSIAVSYTHLTLPTKA